jgi:hypothetical protein
MSEDYQKVERFTNKRFSEVLSAGFSFFGKNWAKLLLPFVSFLIISIILRNLLIVDLNWQNIILSSDLNLILQKDPAEITQMDLSIMMEYLSITLIIGFLDGLIRTMFGVFSMCLFSAYIYKKFIGESPNMLTEVKAAFNKKMIIVLLLLGLGVSLGAVLIYIPSIIIIGFYSFLIFTYSSRSIENPIKKARNIARGSFWKIFGIFFISNLILWGANFIYHLIIDNFLIISQSTYNSWFNPASRNFGMIFLYNFLNEIMELLLSPLFVCLLCSLYVNLSFRDNYSYSILQRNTQYTYEKEAQIPQGKIDKSAMKGLYCPFCGNYMTQRKQFCPNCGEKLSFEM